MGFPVGFPHVLKVCLHNIDTAQIATVRLGRISVIVSNRTVREHCPIINLNNARSSNG